MRRRKLTPAERQKQIEAIRTAVFGSDKRRINQSAVARETGLRQPTISSWKADPTRMSAVGLAKISASQELTDKEIIRIMRMLEDV